jgi:hypothetical protein
MFFWDVMPCHIGGFQCFHHSNIQKHTPNNTAQPQAPCGLLLHQCNTTVTISEKATLSELAAVKVPS